MTSTSECVRELIERIAAGSGVDARVRLEEDAEGVSAKYVHEDLELVIGHQATTTTPFCSTQEIAVRPLDSPARRGDSTAARRRITRVRADPDLPLQLGEHQACGITAPLTNPQKPPLPSVGPTRFCSPHEAATAPWAGGER